MHDRQNSNKYESFLRAIGHLTLERLLDAWNAHRSHKFFSLQFVVFRFRLHSVVEREGEVLAGMLLVFVSSWGSREILEQYDLAELKERQI
jgi:hypothetical protein